MANFLPLSSQNHRDLRLKPASDYAFAAGETTVPLLLAELGAAIADHPIALAALGESFRPVAVLGLGAGHNLQVLSDGSWRGGYIPAQIRAYPFTSTVSPDGKQILLLDQASDRFTREDGPARLFDEAGQPTETLAAIIDFQTKMASAHALTAAACAALQRHGLIVPWTPEVTLPALGKRAVQGLFHVDLPAFGKCSGEVLADLRDHGALLIVHALLLGRRSLQGLADLAGQPRDAAPAAAPGAGRAPLDPALAAVSEGGTLRLSGLGD